jgi:hypothetical protein
MMYFFVCLLCGNKFLRAERELNDNICKGCREIVRKKNLKKGKKK